MYEREEGRQRSTRREAKIGEAGKQRWMSKGTKIKEETLLKTDEEKRRRWKQRLYRDGEAVGVEQ